MSLSELLPIVVSGLTVLGSVLGLLKYIFALGTDRDQAKKDTESLLRQQKRFWTRLEEVEQLVQHEREERIKLRSDFDNYKERVQDLRTTNRFKLVGSVESSEDES